MNKEIKIVDSGVWAIFWAIIILAITIGSDIANDLEAINETLKLCQ